MRNSFGNLNGNPTENLNSSTIFDCAGAKKRERSTSLNNRTVFADECEKPTSNTNMKQSPSSGALNELNAANNDGTLKSSPICLKSRRTAFNNDVLQQSESSKTPSFTSAHASSNTLSSFNSSEYSDFSHGDEFYHELGSKLRNNEADILDAVNMLRVDSQKSLTDLLWEDPTQPLTDNAEKDGKYNNNDKRFGNVENHPPEKQNYATQNLSKTNPVSLYLKLLSTNDDDKSLKSSLTIPGSSLSKDYFHQHTPKEIAAYEQSGIISAIKKEDITGLKALLEDGHPIQCSNKFGESIVHMTCRHGSIPVLLFLLEVAKVSLRVIDDMGRTPYHDACWSSEPRLEMMKILLKADPFLMRISDKRGHIALDYVHKDHWGIWCQFLIEHQHLLVAT